MKRRLSLTLVTVAAGLSLGSLAIAPAAAATPTPGPAPLPPPVGACAFTAPDRLDVVQLLLPVIEWALADPANC